MSGIAIVPHFTVKPEFVDAFLARSQVHRDNCLKLEAGCRLFDILTVDDTPGKVFFYEVYEDEAAVAAHRATPHLQEFRADTEPMLASREVGLWRVAP